MTEDFQPKPHSVEQQQRMLARLQFPAPLESEFREDYEGGAPSPRITLLVLSFVLIVITPLYDVRFLHAPESFVSAARMLQFGVEIPFILLALAITMVRATRGLSAPATAFTAVIVASCLMAQRVIGAPFDFAVPHDFPAITFTAVLFLARLRLFYIVPLVLLGMIGTTIAELSIMHRADALYGVISSWMLVTIGITGAYTLEYSARQSWYRGRLLEFQASRDALTGLPNRRHFDLQLRELLRDAARQHKNVALLMIDIDHFKAFNDHYGHPLGDECLRRVGVRLKMAMRRPRDFCARVGGEEFAAVWFDAAPADAIRLAEALRLTIEELGIPSAPGFGKSVTASAGFVQVITPSTADTPDRIGNDLMKAADAALYDAKRAGRARMVIAGSPTGTRIDTA